MNKQYKKFFQTKSYKVVIFSFSMFILMAGIGNLAGGTKINSINSEDNCQYPFGFIEPDKQVNHNLPLMIDDPPQSWDWRSATYMGITGDWTTSVKSQGCGDCYDFAAHGAFEAAVNIQNLDPNLDMDFSEQYILSCAPGLGCNGGNAYNVYDYLYSQGALLESCFPYEGDDTVPCSDKCTDWQQHLYPILDFGSNWYPGVNTIKSLIYNIGPVCLDFLVYEDFTTYPGESWDDDGVYTYDGTSSYEGSHQITVVGYEDTPGNPDYDGYWICKNSWGSTWGPWYGFFGIAYGTCEIEDYVVWVEVESAEELSYAPMSHNFGVVDEGNTYQTSFEIWNDGIAGTLDWSLSDDRPWLSYSPTSGSSTDEYDAVTVTIDTEGLSPGSYTGNISISTNDENGNFFISFDILDYPPTACYTWVDADGMNSGTSIDFYASCSTDDVGIISYEWDWTSDGTFDYTGGPTVSHDYGDAESYLATLKVTDTSGQTHEVSSTVQANNMIDINQNLYDRPFLVRHASDGDWGGAQDFKCNFNVLTRAELFLKVLGTPEFDLTVELRKDSIDGELLDTATYNPDDLPSDWGWINFDFEDVDVNADADYFIVLCPPPTGLTNTFGYGWAYAIGDIYNDGSLWFTRTSGSFWLDLPDLYDYTFRTYGYQ